MAYNYSALYGHAYCDMHKSKMFLDVFANKKFPREEMKMLIPLLCSIAGFHGKKCWNGERERE
jgi:hypothetical protein